ncbi:hypothetical protein YTPLAS72_34270 [Nitrospira sp.]|nr:hypothetical protein YTPLAS72_34270 [Nitrospira sp.]
MRNCKRDVLKVWLLLMGITLCVACTDGEVTEGTAPVSRHSTNRPPVVTTAAIVDTPLSQSAPAAVQIQSEDPEREAVSFHYQWYVDNTPVAGQTSATLPPEFFRRGQTVFVEIIPTDGTSKGQLYRTVGVVVGNSLPKISAISLVPQTVRAGERLEAQVQASDPDHDRIDLIYKWYRNDTLIKEGEDPFLDTVGFSAPDQVAVEVTASDPTGSASSLKSESLALGNSGPMIVSTPPTKAVQERFDYSVKALDPDGDPLTYHLEMAPPGMTISSDTGHIGWQIPTDQEGTFHVRVVAKDGRGGLATQEFDVTLSATTSPAPRGA